MIRGLTALVLQKGPWNGDFNKETVTPKPGVGGGELEQGLAGGHTGPEVSRT